MVLCGLLDCPGILQNRFFQIVSIRILHFSRPLFRHGIGFFKDHAPFKKQRRPAPHGMATCFHYDKLTFGHGL